CEPTDRAIVARALPAGRSIRSGRSFPRDQELSSPDGSSDRGVDYQGTKTLGLGFEETAATVDRGLPGRGVSTAINGGHDSGAPRDGGGENREATSGRARCSRSEISGQRPERAHDHRLQGALSATERPVLLSADLSGFGEPVPAGL